MPLDLEIDRWLVVVREAFLDRNVQPLRLDSRTSNSSCDWTHGLDRTVSAEISKQASGQRFVMITDGALRKQKMFVYRDRANLPSPLDFLVQACVLRAREATTEVRAAA